MIITAKMIWYQCCEIKYKYAAELKYFHLLTLKKTSYQGQKESPTVW